MRIAITGTTGRVGCALARKLAAHHDIIDLPRSIFDLANCESFKQSLEQLDCDLFINPAGITNLEACEDDPILAKRVNSDAPGEIAKWASGRSVRMMHFSTDYVFAGNKSDLYEERDLPAPHSIYGITKHAGELAVLSYPDNLVIRVSWVFGPEKPSFIDQIFNAALANHPLSAVVDKFSLPTSTEDLANSVEALISADATGLVHACNTGEPVSWHGMAVLVVREMQSLGIIDSCPDVLAQKLDEIASFRAIRPKFSAMNTGKLESILGWAPRPWVISIAEHVRHLAKTRLT